MEDYQILLIIFAFLAVLIGLLAYQIRGPEDSFPVALLRLLCLALCRSVHRLRRDVPSDPLPMQGSCIVVANHRSGVDPVLVSAITKRRIRFLMAREYYDTTGIRWLFRLLDCIPVNRDGNDLSATRKALEALRSGRTIGIFPQGGIREPDDDLETIKAGVGLLAMRSGAPVVPLYIEGSPICESTFAAVLRPSRSRIYCGEPLRARTSKDGGKPSRADLEEFTALILRAITSLRERARESSVGRSSSKSNGSPVSQSIPDSR